MTTLGLAAIQLAGQKAGNLDLVEDEIRNTARRFPWVELITLGELAIHGAKTDSAEQPDGPTITRLQAIAKDVGAWLVPGSIYQHTDAGVANISPVIDPAGELVASYAKMFPFLPYEKDVAPGRNYCVFDIPGKGRVGLAICYDMWFPEVIRTLAGMGAEIILLPTMTNTIDRDVELSIARANAAINQCYFIDVNVAGEQGNGRSVFYGPGGELIHECGAGREVVALELDFEQVRRARSRGWHGLGQVLKSFRDSDVQFPLHENASERQGQMRELGVLSMPGAGDGKNKNNRTEEDTVRKLRVIE